MQPPTISVKKTAFTASGAECADPCTLQAGTTSLKYTLTGKVETSGTGSPPGVASLTLKDTIPNGMSVTATVCTATKAGGAGGATPLPQAHCITEMPRHILFPLLLTLHRHVIMQHVY